MTTVDLHTRRRNDIVLRCPGSDHQVVVYDKTRQLRSEGEPLTRIEVRCRRSRCPVGRLGELPRLAEADPFAGVLFAPNAAADTSKLERSKLLRAIGATCCFEHQNMSRDELVRRLGRNGARTLSAVLSGVPTVETPDLQALYAASIAEWLSR